MDAFGRRSLDARCPHPDRRLGLRRWTARRWRLVRSATLILALVHPAHLGHARQAEALARYEQWRADAGRGTLPDGVACELFDATRALYEARSEAVDPRELLAVAVAAAAACPDQPLARLQAVSWSASTLRGSGEPEAATALLETQLPFLVERFPDHQTTFLLELNLLQLWREQDRWREALDLAQAMQPRLVASSSRAVFESTLYGERASLYLAWGLTDLAWRWHARQREALSGPAANARRHADLVEANLLLAETDDVRGYARAEARILEMLADDGLYRPDALPAFPRGRLLVRAALARLGAAEGVPDRAEEARELLEEALAIERLEPYERRYANLVLAEIELCRDALDEVEAALVRALAPEIGPLPPIVAAMGATLRSALARRRGQRPALLAARDELERTVRDFLEAWRRLPLREGGFGFFLFRENQRIVGERIEVELALDDGPGGVERALEVVLRAQSLSSLARAIGGDAVATLDEVRAELLGPREGLLVFVPSPERCHLFAVDGATVTHHALPPLGALAVSHDRFLRRFLVPPRAGSPERADFERERAEALEDLARGMLPPAARSRLEAWEAVTWVGTDNLSALPCEELPLGEGRRLGTSLAVGYVDSLTTALALERRRVRRPPFDDSPRDDSKWGASYLIACPDPTPGVGPGADLEILPLDERAARDFLAGLPEPRELRFGALATPAALAEAGAQHARYLAVVAHGVRDPEQERPAAIQLAPTDGGTGVVGCGDLEAWNLPGFVTLLACSTQSGPGRVGDPGAADLGGACLRAGADCVLLSPFRIDFHAARALGASFHEHLARGGSPAQALRAARAAVEHDGRVDPRLAPLRLAGLAHRPVFPRSDEPREPRSGPRPATGLWIGAGLLGLLVWSGVRRRRRTAARALRG